MDLKVKKVFSIQEERQKQYSALRKIQSEYSSRLCSHHFYTESMGRITTRFQSLSKEVIDIIGTFRGAGLLEVVRILEGIQQMEKAKLELTVKWQVMDQEGSTGCGSQKKDEDGECGYKKTEMRRKLAAVEGSIASLLQDLKFECEPFLVKDMVVTDT